MDSRAAASFSKRHQISDTHTDFKRRLRLSAMFEMCQDIAGEHAGLLGGDVRQLREERGVAWILIRMRVEVDKYPRLRDEIVLETWPQKPRAFYERDYTLKDLDGNTLVRVGSTWVIMNLEKREIVREMFLDYHRLAMREDRALGRSLGKLRREEGAKAVFERPIAYSDIDYNGHINNARYVDFVMDAIPFEEHERREIRAFEINYMNELGAGGALEVRRAQIAAAGAAGGPCVGDGAGTAAGAGADAEDGGAAIGGGPGGAAGAASGASYFEGVRAGDGGLAFVARVES